GEVRGCGRENRRPGGLRPRRIRQCALGKGVIALSRPNSAPELHTISKWRCQIAPGRLPKHKGAVMLRGALVFLVVAIIAAVLGFGGIAGDAAWVAKILFFVFLIVFVVSLLMGRRGPTTI